MGCIEGLLFVFRFACFASCGGEACAVLPVARSNAVCVQRRRGKEGHRRHDGMVRVRRQCHPVKRGCGDSEDIVRSRIRQSLAGRRECRRIWRTRSRRRWIWHWHERDGRNCAALRPEHGLGRFRPVVGSCFYEWIVYQKRQGGIPSDQVGADRATCAC